MVVRVLPSKRVVDYLKTVETLVSPARHLPLDPPNVITGGYGETDPSLVQEGMIVPPSLADEWLQRRINSISSRITLKLRQGQFDCMFSFAYNLGVQRLLDSDFYKLHVAGDKLGAIKDLLTYTHSNGKEREGLLGRRCLEAYWYLST